MELYKFIDENTIKKAEDGFVVKDKTIYVHPTEARIRSVGYKELVFDEEPEYDETREYLKVTYTDGDVIAAHYTVLPIEAEKETETEE